jgi:hypothetical protein
MAQRTSLTKYAKNLVKSTKYATVDVVKELMPSATDFMETNNELFKDITSNIRNRRVIFKRVNDKVTQSKIYETVDEARKNIIEDIKSGNLYNKDPIRERRINKKSGMESMLGGFDDFSDFEFEMDDSFEFEDSDNAELADAFDDSNRTTSEMIANTIAKTSSNQIQSQRISSQMTMMQLQEGFTLVNSNLGGIGNAISELGNTMSSIQQTNAENAKTYYEKSTDLQANMVSYLKELVDMKKSEMGLDAKKDTSRGPKSYNDITTYEGMPDLRAYGNILASKLNDNLSMITGLNEMGIEGGNMSMQFAMSPLAFLPKMVVKKVMGVAVQNSAKALDNTLSNIFGTFISAMNDMADNSGYMSIKGMIGRFFGLNDTVKDERSIRTDYDKGNKSWNGKAEKALTEVIPTLISKILAVVSGANEMTYNYDNGKFTTVKQLRQDVKNRTTNEMNSAFYDIRNKMDEMMRSINFDFSDEDTKASFEKDYNRFFEYFFKSNNRFNPNKKNYEDYDGLGIDRGNFEIISTLFERLDPSLKMSMDSKKIRARGAINDYIDKLGQNSPVYTILNNDSKLTDVDKSVDGKSGGLLTASKDSLGHDIFWFLDNILKSIRDLNPDSEYNVNGKKRKKKRTKNITSTPIVPSSDKTSSAGNRKRYVSPDALTAESILYNRAEGTTISGIINNRLDIADEQRKLEEEEKTSIIDDLLDSPSLPAKAKAFMKRMKSTKEGARNGISGLLDTVNLKIYQAMYGNKKYKGKDVNGIIGVMMENIEESFTKFNTFLDEKILSPLKEKLDEQGGIKGILKNTLGIDVDSIKERFFGKDTLFGRTVQSIKDNFKSAYEYSKGAVKNTYNEIYDKLGGNRYNSRFNRVMNTIKYGKKNTQGMFIVDSDGQLNILNQVKKVKPSNVTEDGRLNTQEEASSVMEGQMSFLPKDEQQAIKEAANNMNVPVENIADAINKGNIEKYAKGGNIHKTKIVMVHDGEEIITKEEKRKRDRERAYDLRVKNNINKLNTEMSEDFVGPLPLKDQKIKDFLSGINEENLGTIKDSLGKDFKATTVETLRQEIIEAVGHKKGDPTLMETMKDTASDGINKVMSVLFGTDENGDEKADDLKERGKAAMKDIMGKFKEYLPSGISGALIGTLAGGVVGMPMIGAALGSSINLIRKSDKLQSYLFGDLDEEGKRIGNGKLPTKFVDAMNKYGPDMKKYGITGAITSILPFVPGGPVAGLLLGAGVGFAKNNAKVQDFLFGDMGILKGLKGSGEKLKKALPKMGLGAAALALTGPFGLLGNAMLGAGAGFVTQTNKFQEFMFGKDGKDKDGNPIKVGGFLPMIRDRVINPIKEFGSTLGDKVKTFVDEEIRKPFHKAMSPFIEEFKYQGKRLFDGIKDSISGAINNVFEKSVGKPLNELIEDKIVKPITGLFKKVFNFLGGIVGGILKFPTKIMSGAADSLRIKHLKQGRADYMSDEELGELKEKKPFDYLMATSGQRFINALNERGLFGSMKDLFTRDKDEVVTDEESVKEKKPTFREKVSGIVAKGLDSYNAKRLAITERVSSGYANTKEELRNAKQNLKTKAYQAAMNATDKLSASIEAGNRYSKVSSYRESETESEGDSTGSSEKRVDLRTRTPKIKSVKTQNVSLVNPEVDALKQQVKQLTTELAVMQKEKEENKDTSSDKSSEYIKDIRDEVRGQLDGVGYNIHTIANILVEQFGMPKIKATGAKVSRGNLKRKLWFERMFGFILNPVRKVKDSIHNLFWGKDGNGGLLGTPMRWVKKGFEKIGNIGTLIGKGLAGILNIGSGIVHGLGILGGIFKESLAAIAPAIGSLLKGAVKVLTLPIDLLSGAISGLGNMLGGLANGIGILAGKTIELVSLVPSLITNIGKLTIEVGKFAFKLVKKGAELITAPIRWMANGIIDIFRGKNKKNKKKEIKHIIEGGFLDKIKEPIDISGEQDRHDKLLSFFDDKFNKLFDLLSGTDNKKKSITNNITNKEEIEEDKPKLSTEELQKMSFSDYIRSGQSMSLDDLERYADARKNLMTTVKKPEQPANNGDVLKKSLYDIINDNRAGMKPSYDKPLNVQTEEQINMPTEFGVIRYDKDTSGELRPVQDSVYTQYKENQDNLAEHNSKMFNLLNTGDAEDDGKSTKKESWISKIAKNIGSVLMGGTLLKVVGAGLMAGAVYDLAKNGENSFVGKFVSFFSDKVLPKIVDFTINTAIPVLTDALLSLSEMILDRVTNPQKYSNPDHELSKANAKAKLSDGSYITDDGVYDKNGNWIMQSYTPTTTGSLIEKGWNKIAGNKIESWAKDTFGENSIGARLFSTNVLSTTIDDKEIENVSHKNSETTKTNKNKEETMSDSEFFSKAIFGKGKKKYGLGESFFSQNDPRWSNLPFNTENDTEAQTIADSGCGPTAAAMVADQYGRANPVEASAFALNNGYKEQNGGTDPRFFKDYFNKKGIDSDIDTDIDTNSDKKLSIINNLRKNKPVVLMGKSKGGNTPYGKEYPHYVVATGMRGDKIQINDPNSNHGGELYDANDTLRSSTISVKTGRGKKSKYGRVNMQAMLDTTMNVAGAVSGAVMPTSSTSSVARTVTNNFSSASGFATSSDGSLTEGKSALNFVTDLGTTFTKAIGEFFGVDMFSSNTASRDVGSYGSMGGSVQVGTAGQCFDANVAAQVINDFFKNSPKLSGKGATIVSIAQQACHKSANGQNPGIDPFILAAIMMQETGGNSNALNNKNNPGGVKGSNGLQVFSTIEDGIMAVAKIIHREWVVNGNSSIAGLGSIYCPVDAADDPNGLNKNWVGGVTKFYNQLVQAAIAAGGLLGTSDNMAISNMGTANNVAIQIVRIAKSYIGKVKYVFGAETPDKGVSDCSGFTQAVYRKVGLAIGRNTEAQITNKNIVKVSDSYNFKAQPGDLIFFKNTYNSGYIYGVSHVGICTGEGTKFIECNSSKGVCVSDYTSNYCKKYFLMIKRHTACVDKNAMYKTSQAQQTAKKANTTTATTTTKSNDPLKNANNAINSKNATYNAYNTLSGKGKSKDIRYNSDIKKPSKRINRTVSSNNDYLEEINYGKGIGKVNLEKLKKLPKVQKLISEELSKAVKNKSKTPVSTAAAKVYAKLKASKFTDVTDSEGNYIDFVELERNNNATPIVDGKLNLREFDADGKLIDWDAVNEKNGVVTKQDDTPVIGEANPISTVLNTIYNKLTGNNQDTAKKEDLDSEGNKIDWNEVEKNNNIEVKIPTNASQLTDQQLKKKEAENNTTQTNTTSTNNNTKEQQQIEAQQKAVEAKQTQVDNQLTALTNIAKSVESIYNLILLLVNNGIDIKNLAEILKAIGVSSCDGGSNNAFFIPQNNTQSSDAHNADMELLSKLKEIAK